MKSSKQAKSIIGDNLLSWIIFYHPRPTRTGKTSSTHDFNVTTIYLDSISAEEKKL